MQVFIEGRSTPTGLDSGRLDVIPSFQGVPAEAGARWSGRPREVVTAGGGHMGAHAEG